MPIYEYECQKCGHWFEAMQKISDAPLRKCPSCGALRLKKLLSAPNFRLKGSGWYETDFKKDNQRRLADSGDGKAAGETAGKEGKEDKKDKKDKPDGKAEPKKAAAAKETPKPAGGSTD